MQNDRRWLIINEPLTIPGMHIQVNGNAFHAFHAFHAFLTCGESQGMRSRKSSQASKIPLRTRNGCSRIFPKCSFVAGESHIMCIIHQGAFWGNSFQECFQMSSTKLPPENMSLQNMSLGMVGAPSPSSVGTNWIQIWDTPLVNIQKNYGKSPCLIGKSSRNDHFQ